VSILPASKKELRKYNRYELRAINPHFGQSIVGIYQTLKEARKVLEIKYASSDMRVIIYDTITQEKKERI
jgi:hypothetical protein